jgi:periplasmic protein TonB
MNGPLEGSEQLELELTPEPVMGPAAGSVVLHLCVGAAILLYGILGGFFHHNLWGNAGTGGAIQVNLVSNALPLPSDQPVNKNVLATETPSPAPAPPTPKAKQEVDQTAIPILGRQKKPQHEQVRRTPPRQQEPIPNTRATYGEQSGSSMPRATVTQNATPSQTTVANSSFGSLFGWYVDGITRKMSQNWYKALVDPSTPRGAKAYIQFKIYRDGSVGEVQMQQTSGSPTLDSSCLRAAERANNFGNLPSGYRDTYLQVYYYCEY